MSENSANLPGDGFARQAALALAVGAAVTPLAAQASPIVTQANQSFPATISFAGAQQFSISGAPGATVTGSGSNLVEVTSGTTAATKLGAGSVVGPTTFGTGAGTATLGSVVSGPKTTGSYFIGLDIQQGSQNNFGYAEIGASLAGAQPATTLIEYAFETSPNTSIGIPVPAAVPEPESLALLAAGAIGALAVRRRTAARGSAC